MADCIYCYLNVYIEEPGWGFVELSNELFHMECIEVYENVHLMEGEL